MAVAMGPGAARGAWVGPPEPQWAGADAAAAAVGSGTFSGALGDLRRCHGLGEGRGGGIYSPIYVHMYTPEIIKHIEN